MDRFTSSKPPVLEILEDRLLLFADNTTAIGGATEPSGSRDTPSDMVHTWLVPEYEWIGANADYDDWYGNAPTIVGMLTAYWDHYLKVSSGNYDQSVFPGDSTNWLYRADVTGNNLAPGMLVDRTREIDSKPFSVPQYANGVVAGWAHASTAL